MLNFHKIKIEYWKVIEGDSFQRVGGSEGSRGARGATTQTGVSSGDGGLLGPGQGGQGVLSAS